MVVRIDSWESTSLYPDGHSVRVLGRAGELETEVQTILVENCIHVPPFSDAQVRRCWDQRHITPQHKTLIIGDAFIKHRDYSEFVGTSYLTGPSNCSHIVFILIHADSSFQLYFGIWPTKCDRKCSICDTVWPQLKEMPTTSPEKPWRVDPAQVLQRRDLRDGRLVFSIDPRGCEDVDDALSVHSLDGGRLLELGVHIADVSHFVTEGSLTDLEARSR